MENGKFQIEVLERLSVLETLIKEQDYKELKIQVKKHLIQPKIMKVG